MKLHTGENGETNAICIDYDWEDLPAEYQREGDNDNWAAMVRHWVNGGMCKVWNGVLNVDLTDLVGTSGVPVERATGLLTAWRRTLLEGRLDMWQARNAIVHSPDREKVRLRARNVEREAKRFCARHNVDANITEVVNMDDGARQQWYARVRQNQRDGRQRQPRMDEVFEISDRIGPERRGSRAQGIRTRKRGRQAVMDQLVTKRARVATAPTRTVAVTAPTRPGCTWQKR